MIRIGVITSEAHAITGGRFSQHLYALWYFKRQLQSAGLKILFLPLGKTVSGHFDWVLVDSKSQRAGLTKPPGWPQCLAVEWRKKCGRIAFLDNSDASGTTQFEVLEAYDLYFKKQLYVDRTAYSRKEQDNRIHCEFYRNQMRLEAQPASSPRVALAASDYSRVKLSWNLCLSNNVQPGRGARIRRGLARIPLPLPARHEKARDKVFARWSQNHSLAAVAFQRRELELAMSRHESSKSILVGTTTPRRYLRELRSAIAVVSPFGFGELCYRDLEAFCAGVALLKPDVGHLETWPPIYHAGETYVSLPWDITSMAESILHLLQSPAHLLQIGARGRTVLEHYWTDAGGQLFSKRLASLLE
jgi:hypothetical protein